jgi:hypothetical protein
LLGAGVPLLIGIPLRTAYVFAGYLQGYLISKPPFKSDLTEY